MTDMVSPATLTWGEGRRGIHTTAQADARLRKRYAAELRFKLFGLAAVSVAILALVVLLGSILHGGITAFVFGGVLIGISFFLLNNVFGYIGNLGNWLPWLTAAAPGLIYSVLSLGAFGWLVLRR